MFGIIYRAVNKVNGKVYIGQTIKTLAQRMSQHRSVAFRKNSMDFKFPRAIRKHGWDTFAWCILLECPIDDLDQQEILAIAGHDSYHNGYNMTEGGSSPTASAETREKISKNHADVSGKNNPIFGKKRSEETKKKISEANKNKVGVLNPFFGKKHTEESRAKISEHHADMRGENSPLFGTTLSEEHKKKISKAAKQRIGSLNPFYGKKHSEETRIKISEARKGRKPTKEANQHMSELMKGAGNPMFGKKQSEETKRKRRETVERNKRLKQQNQE